MTGVWLLDTGPLVALLDEKDRFHGWAKSVLRTARRPLLTCEAVLSESCFLLRNVPHASHAILELVRLGAVQVAFSLQDEFATVDRLMSKYEDVPMSLADACLVRMAELQKGSSVVTIDRGFLVYRRHRNAVLRTVMPS